MERGLPIADKRQTPMAVNGVRPCWPQPLVGHGTDGQSLTWNYSVSGGAARTAWRRSPFNRHQLGLRSWAILRDLESISGGQRNGSDRTEPYRSLCCWFIISLARETSRTRCRPVAVGTTRRIFDARAPWLAVVTAVHQSRVDEISVSRRPSHVAAADILRCYLLAPILDCGQRGNTTAHAFVKPPSITWPFNLPQHPASLSF